MDAFIATILPVGFNYPPYGWTPCNGQLLSLSNYQAVYAVVGTSYGGNGVSDFGVPNLQGRHPVGYGQLAGGSYYGIGDAEGQEELILLTSNLPPHNHQATFQPTMGAAPVDLPAVTGTQTVSVKLEAQGVAGQNQIPAANNYLAGSSATSVKSYVNTDTKAVELSGVSATISGQPSIPAMQTTVSTVTGGTVTTGVTGSGVPISTVSPYLAINFIFCLQGIFPSRQ